MNEINALLQEMNEALINKGYVTSKVYIEPQNLSSGKLKISLLVGKIEEIKFTGEKGVYRNALDLRVGEILQIRKIEQSVDNLNSVLHQKATVEIKPGSTTGQSILVFTIKRQGSFLVNVGLDNFGNESTGKFQSNLSLSIARPFNISDSFYYSGTKALPFHGKKQSESNYFSYQVPLGRDNFSLSHSYSNYEQEISYAIHPFKSSGHFMTDEFTWSHLLHRNNKVKTELINKLIHKTRHSYINDNEIDVQKRRTTTWKLGIHQTRYISNGVVDWNIGYMKGLHWWAEPGPSDDATTYYNIYHAKLNYTKKFSLDEKHIGIYKLDVKGQYTTSKLYASEFFSLGGWYNVRGYTGDINLSAENGFYIRNTLEIPTSKYNSIYFAVDFGKVYGDYSSELLGQELTGGVIGVKGNYRNLSYNIFGAYPINKPDGFNVPNKLLGLQLNMSL